MKSTKQSATERPRVLLCDDHRFLREAFAELLAKDCEVVGTVADGRALLDVAPSLSPEIVVLDIAMPLLNGLDAAEQLKRSMPDVKVIFLTVNEDPDLAAEAFRRGAVGYLLKNSAASELLAAIQEARQGRTYITPLLNRRAISDPRRPPAEAGSSAELTPRQREVLQLLAEGHSMKQIARIFKISARTVAFHKYQMMESLGIRSTAELVQYAVKRHVVSL